MDRRITVLLVLMVLALIIGSVALYQYLQPVIGQPKVAPFADTSAAVYKSDVLNFQFPVPDGWEVSPQTVLPAGFRSPYVIVAKKESVCRIAYVPYASERTPGVIYRQVSDADRVFSSHWQFDGDWYAPDHPGLEKIFTDERQYLEREIRIMWGGRREGQFLLWSADGSPVPDDCNDDMNTLIGSVLPHYTPVSLNAASEGMLELYLEHDDVDAGSEQTYVIFTPSGSEERFAVTSLPGGVYPSGDFFVDGSKVYFVGTDYRFENNDAIFSSAIYEFDVFTNEVRRLPSTAHDDAYISALFMHDTQILYLMGDSTLSRCLDGYGNCLATLYATTRTGEASKVLARDVLGGDILGFSSSEQSYYLTRGSGDVGCGNLRVSRVGTQGEERLGEYSGCYGEPAYDALESARASVLAKVDKRTTSGALLVKGGVLLPYQLPGLNQGTTFYFK